MNKMKRKIIVILLGVFCLYPMISIAQDTLYYEFECGILGKTDVYPVYKHEDSVLIISNFFGEMDISGDVAFRFQDGCVFLTIAGQMGLFFGNPQIGSWNTEGLESECFTILWDSLYCPSIGEMIYKFKFAPYYNETNPYIMDDGTAVFQKYDDMVLYYWTKSAGIIAMEGDFLFVRKDQKIVEQCL